MANNISPKEEKMALGINVISIWLIVMQYYTLIRYMPVYLKHRDADYEGVANMMHNAMILGYIGEIIRAILFFILLYRVWSMLQGKTARTSAGAAIGLLFIPVYNIYWIFVSFLGWVTDANTLLKRYGQTNMLSKKAPAIFISSILLMFISAFLMIAVDIYNVLNHGAVKQDVMTFVYIPLGTVYNIAYLMFANLLVRGITRLRSLV